MTRSLGSKSPTAGMADSPPQKGSWSAWVSFRERYAAQRQGRIFCPRRDLRVRRLPLDALHIKLKTLAEVATVLLPNGEQL